MQTVYKVIKASLRQPDEIDNETLRSSSAPDPYDAEYLIGKTILPPIAGSYLYAFDNQADAQRYVGHSKNSILTEAAVLRVYAAEAVVFNGQPYYTLEDPERFWAEQWWHFYDGWPHVIPCIPGTIWCSSIKLKDLVYTDGRTLKVKRKPQPAYAKPGYNRYR